MASGRELLANVELMLKDLVSVRFAYCLIHMFNSIILQRAFIAVPDAFVSPRSWIQNSPLLESILMREELFKDESDSPSSRSVQALRQTIMDQLADVKQRNEAMLFRHLPPRVLGALTSSLSDIKVFHSLCDFLV